MFFVGDAAVLPDLPGPPGSPRLGVMMPILGQMAKVLGRAEGALWASEARSATVNQVIARRSQASQRLMDLQEAPATAGAQYVLARLRVCHPDWSTRGIVTTEPEACPAQNYYGDVESSAALAAAESRHQA